MGTYLFVVGLAALVASFCLSATDRHPPRVGVFSFGPVEVEWQADRGLPLALASLACFALALIVAVAA